MEIKAGNRIQINIDFDGFPVEKNHNYYLSIDALVLAVFHLKNVKYAVLCSGTGISPNEILVEENVKELRTSKHCSSISNLENYMGKKIRWVSDAEVIKVWYGSDFFQCCKCKDWIYLGGSNQSDGSMICYPCRQDPYRCKL